MVAKADIPGLPKLQAQLRNIPRDVELALPVTYARPLSKAASDARSRAPRLTGALQNSIHADRLSIVADAPHALITEYGGSHPVFGNDPRVTVQPRPFLRPALEENSRPLMEANKDAVMIAARKAGFR